MPRLKLQLSKRAALLSTLGIDLTLKLIADEAGTVAAAKVQFAAEYYPSSARYGEYTSDPRAPAYIKEA